MKLVRCPHCQHLARIERLVAAKVARPATLHNCSADAGRNEFATAIFAAKDVIDPHAAPLVVFGQGDYRRAIHPKP